MEPSSGRNGDVGTAVHDLINGARVSGDEIGIVVENGAKVMDKSSSDALVSSVPPANSEIAATNEINIGAGLLESETGTLTIERSSNHDGGGDVVVHQDSVDDAMVSGDEKVTVMENVVDESSSDAVVSSTEPIKSEIAASNGVSTGAGFLEIKSQTLTMESSSSHDGGDGIVVHQDSVDDARVSGDERGTVMEDVEKVLDEPRSDAVVLSVPTSNGDIAASNEAEAEAEAEAGLLESKTGSLSMEPTSNHDGRADVVFHQDSVDDARVSGDEKGTVMEDAEKLLNESRSDAVVSSVPPINSDVAASNRVNIEADMLESKTGMLTVEPSCSHYEDGDIAVQDSTDDARVSGDEKGIVVENIDEVLDENEVTAEEKEGDYKVTDLVWAKVRCYPWWPGQIFDPSASTDTAKKYSNKKGFLVGYFGDQTFAWNEASKIKPFRKNFYKLEKQSNSKGFLHAVNCALDEITRRIEFGLACSCLSKEVYGNIKSQVFVNAGIREEVSKIDGGDRFSTVATFKPANIVHSVQDLAREHFDGFSRLDILSLRAQLLAYNRWNGYNQYQAHNLLDGLSTKLGDNSELPLMETLKIVEEAKPASLGEKVSSKKRKLNSCDSSPRKHQHASNNDSVPSKKGKRLTNVSTKGRHKDVSNSDSVLIKKEKSLTNVSPKGKHQHVSSDSVPSKKEKRLTNVSPKASTSVTKGENKRIKIGGKKANIEPNGFKARSGSGTAYQKSSISPPKKLLRIGDTICRIAKEISESPSILKKESHKSKNNEKCVEQTEESKENSATALILKFGNLDSIPSVTKLNEVFSRYGSVRETETKVMKKNNCAKVVFEEQSNAETAFSSAGKFSIFGPSLISYRLDYSPTSRKTPKKAGKSVDAIQSEE